MSLEELDTQHRRKDFIYIQKSSLKLAEEQGMKKGMVKGVELVARNLLASGLPAAEVM